MGLHMEQFLQTGFSQIRIHDQHPFPQLGKCYGHVRYCGRLPLGRQSTGHSDILGRAIRMGQHDGRSDSPVILGNRKLGMEKIDEFSPGFSSLEE